VVVALELEAQGKAQGESAFHLKYSDPSAECVVESFVAGDIAVMAHYNPWEKGLSTLQYRFDVDRPTGKTQVLVLYSGTASLVYGGGYVLHVSEERDGVISWYAMYRDTPPYPAIKTLVEQIVNGTAKPLMAVRWPSGAKEGEILTFDSKRLK
jgi:hypothetical protein